MRIEDMNTEELEYLNGEIITLEDSEELDMNENVVSNDCLGMSSVYPECNWYSVELVNGYTIDVYIPRSEFED